MPLGALPLPSIVGGKKKGKEAFVTSLPSGSGNLPMRKQHLTFLVVLSFLVALLVLMRMGYSMDGRVNCGVLTFLLQCLGQPISWRFSLWWRWRPFSSLEKKLCLLSLLLKSLCENTWWTPPQCFVNLRQLGLLQSFHMFLWIKSTWITFILSSIIRKILRRVFKSRAAKCFTMKTRSSILLRSPPLPFIQQRIRLSINLLKKSFYLFGKRQSTWGCSN